MTLGLKEQMKQSKTLKECEELYNYGKARFTSPSGKTKRQWERILDNKSKQKVKKNSK